MIRTLTIPEIILSIAVFLSRPYLVHCTLVCKDWHAIFQPLLFRTVVATDFDRPGFVSVLQIHTRFTTSIEWIQEPRVAPLVPKKSPWYHIFHRKAPTRPITQIQRPFEQLETSLMAAQTPSMGRLSVQLCNQDPNLTLRLSASTIVNLHISTRGYPTGKPRMYIDILQAYPNLIKLTLEGLFTLDSHPFNDMGHSSSMPTTPMAGEAPAAVATTTGLTNSLPFQAPTIVTGLAHSSSIQTLNLRLVDISQNGLLALSSLLPGLTELLIVYFILAGMMENVCRWTWSTEFIQSLPSAFPHLRSIRFGFMFEKIKEDTIVEILEALSLLTTVGFRNAHFGKRAMETLQQRCMHVECLDVSFGHGGLEFKGALLRFLHTWPRLRELKAHGVVFLLDEPVDAGVTRESWACTNLEKLICGFRGTEPMIFQYLSQLRMMSHLTIVRPNLTIFPVELTLAWMVKSTRMQYFGFTNRDSLPLDKAAMHWILQHWPDLKKLHVAGEVIDQRETVKKWCRDTRRLGVVVEYDGM